MKSKRQEEIERMIEKLANFFGETTKCGLLYFCRYCNKGEENPCEVAEKIAKSMKSKTNANNAKTIKDGDKEIMFRATGHKE